ncbi:MAG: methionine gamma-lyase family protein, partial [Oscillospiraceae bacterium]|nr:methionine gamma-lyase family protein [Oscillospiraceae bacterium]
MSFSQELLTKANEAEQLCFASGAFARIEATARTNGEKVLRAFINNRVEERHLGGSNGYGYGDDGRDTLDRVYAEVFGTQAALVRHNFVSGTHAIATALFAVLKAGDRLVSVSGRPYDTLATLIDGGAFREQEIEYHQIELCASGVADYEAIAREANNARVVYVQRSRGYSLREPLTVAQIGEIVKTAKETNPDVIVVVDNC